jgi:hypothetical protein
MHVSDGDTVWVQPLQGGEAYKVRLQGIDAPEICQPWGPQARAALHAVLQGQVVEVLGTRGTAMAACWHSCHAKGKTWARGWWGRATRGLAATNTTWVCMTRCKRWRKAKG